MNPLHHLLVLFLVVVFPVWDRYETRRLKASTDPRDRVRAYRMTIGWQLAATALLMATLPLASLFTPPPHGRVFGRTLEPAMVLPIAGGLLMGAAIPFILSIVNPELREKQSAALQTIDFFLPRTREERLWFAALSVTVGVCEEIIYRGFLIRYMLALPFVPGVGVAILAAALVFGIDHGYQGVAGMVSTTILALVMTVLFLATGSLWVPMLIHALLDLRILLLVKGTEAQR